jgi:hypothetical protein
MLPPMLVSKAVVAIASLEVIREDGTNLESPS